MLRGVKGPTAWPQLAKRVALRRLFEQADKARDQRDWPGAARRYGRLTRLFPLAAGLHVQHGNMLKECGRLVEARQSYDAARRLAPADADVWLQLGHLAKLQGRPDEAASCYARSAELDPGRPDAADELARLGESQGVDWSAQIGALQDAVGPGRQGLPRARLASATGPMLVLERLRVSFAYQLR